MTALLNDVLSIGQAEAGKLEFNPEPLDLEEFCGYQKSRGFTRWSDCGEE
jgi:signal transduction histidine kinase